MERTVAIVNRLGLHARAAAKLVTMASLFKADIRVRKGPREVSGKGSQITLIAEGDDAAIALERMAELVANRFGEDS